MKQVFKYARPYRLKLALTGLLYIVTTVCTLLMPYIMSDIVNIGIAGRDMDYILTRSGMMLGLALVALACGVLITKLNAGVSTRFAADLTRAVFAKVNSLTFEEYSSLGTASLLTRSTDDIFEMQDAANMAVYTVVSVPIMFIGGSVLAFISSPLLALIMVIIAPLVLLIVRLVTRRMGELWERSDEYVDKQNKVVRERLSGIRVIRAFDKEDSEHGRIAEATTEMAKNIIKANVIAGVINPLCMLLLNIGTVVILGIAMTRMKTDPSMTAGAVIATIQYIALIMNGLLTLSFMFAWLPHLKVCVRRVSEVLLMKGLSSESTESGRLSGDVCLKDVCFAYGGSQNNALTDISMDIGNGEIAAIIGGTGSGKTTVVKLLMDFYAPGSGSVSLGGRDYAGLSRETVRNNIAIALQKSMVFEGSVAENIRMGKPDASEDELADAARTAQIYDFIAEQEDGFDYRLAQSGSNISGGQKQRINIARTIIKPASVYIFDDSFSALDYLTESRLRRELNARLDGKTQIIITQRAATAMRCDKIFVMDRGCIVGSGTHAELMESCDIYREIYDSQLGGEDR